jgi:hypothetical protein
LVPLALGARPLPQGFEFCDPSESSSSSKTPAGQRDVMRAGEEIRIADIALLPACCNRGVGTTLLRGLQSEAAAAGKPRLRASRYGGQAAAHPRRTVQSRAPAL